MRDIKFRGLYNGIWVYGNLIQGVYDGKPFTQIEYTDNNDFHKWDVDPETFGQFTGLSDKNGVEIYEGDICGSNYFNGGKVVFWNNGWHFEFSPDYHHSFNTASHTFEVIANAHQKPEKTAVTPTK